MPHTWQQAHKQHIPSWDPCQHGWSVENGRLVPVWFTGYRVPMDPLYEDRSTHEEYENEVDDIDDADEDDDYTSYDESVDDI